MGTKNPQSIPTAPLPLCVEVELRILKIFGPCECISGNLQQKMLHCHVYVLSPACFIASDWNSSAAPAAASTVQVLLVGDALIAS